MECLKMITVRHKGVAQKVPCGKCAFCLTNKRSQWMFRIYHEMRTQERPGWFLTLTYDERHVKRTPDGRLSLRFKDVQKFLKKIRKHKFYAKYICVGEYGSKTSRPHYHLLLWTDCPADRLQELWSTKQGVPLGNIHFGRITMESAMYTLKYIIQPKQKAVDGIEKTRAQFSRGLGLAYLTTAVYYHHTLDYEQPVFVSVVDGRQVALPRYYKYKIFTKYQLRKEAFKVKMKSLKEYRKKRLALWRQGRLDADEYLLNLREEECKRILKKTKFTEML